LTKSCVIIQPSYFAWRGQFQLQEKADSVVLLDSVKWAKRTWFNRNRIGTPTGPTWLTVPVAGRNLQQADIFEVQIDNSQDWRDRHLSLLRQNYQGAPGYERVMPHIETLLGRNWTYIARLSEASLTLCFELLGKDIHYERASEMVLESSDPVGRLIEICRLSGADHYISGPAAKDYIGDRDDFERAGIRLEWMAYHCPPYPAWHKKGNVGADGPVELSVLDILMSCEAPGQYVW